MKLTNEFIVVVAFLAACSTSQGADVADTDNAGTGTATDAGAAGGTGTGATNDTAGAIATDGATSAQSDDGATSAQNEVDSGPCEDPHQFGDYKVAQDTCWDPPMHYCSQGAGGGTVKACSKDGTFCCKYPTTCIPCNMIACVFKSCEKPEGCAGPPCEKPVTVNAVTCNWPDPKAVFCWDGR